MDDVNPVGPKRCDFEPLTQEEGGAAPFNRGIGDSQPDALAVGDGDRGDPRIGRQGALNAADLDLTVRRRKLVLDEIGEERTRLRFRFLRAGGDREDETCKGDENSDQNACPIPT